MTPKEGFKCECGATHYNVATDAETGEEFFLCGRRFSPSPAGLDAEFPEDEVTYERRTATDGSTFNARVPDRTRAAQQQMVDDISERVLPEREWPKP